MFEKWKWLFHLAKRKFKDGSQISPLDKEHYSYAEPDGHVLEVPFMMTGDSLSEEKTGVDRETALECFRYWSPPYSKEPISQEKRREILKKFETYFSERGTTWRLLRKVPRD